MRSLFIATGLLIAIAWKSYTQTADLKGRVVYENGMPAEGVAVVIAALSLSDTTGGNGLYHITSGQSSLPPSNRNHNPILIIGSRLFFQVTGKKRISISIHSFTGAFIADLYQAVLETGFYSLNVSHGLESYRGSLFFARVRLGDRVSYHKFINLGRDEHLSLLPREEYYPCKLAKAVNASQINELAFYKEGVMIGTMDIETYIDSLPDFIISTIPTGNPDGNCAIPTEAGPGDVSNPDQVVGAGTPESCTAEAFIEAVALGGTIVFDCGPDPVIITLDRPAKVVNDRDSNIVIDGGGRVTLSGGGVTRILYMNTCDPDQVWTTDHCQNQDHPKLTVQNLAFINGNSRNETEYDGGGAIWVRGGRFKIINCRFFNNTCDSLGPDVGGAAVRVFSQYEGLPVYVVNSTFGGSGGFGNYGSNGGGISSIGVSWTIINSLFSHNRAIGNGGNPAEEGTPGGGSGGAIYNDGNTMSLSLCGTLIEYNQVNAYGAAIFFVTNDHTGDIYIANSTIHNNIGGSWHELPGISMHSDTRREIINSTIE